MFQICILKQNLFFLMGIAKVINLWYPTMNLNWYYIVVLILKIKLSIYLSIYIPEGWSKEKLSIYYFKAKFIIQLHKTEWQRRWLEVEAIASYIQAFLKVENILIFSEAHIWLIFFQSNKKETTDWKLQRGKMLNPFPSPFLFLIHI